MTQRNLFLSSGVSPPLERWHKAFPDGKRGSYAAIVKAARVAEAVVWMSTLSADWETVLKSFRREAPQAGIVVLSLAPSSSEALRALDAGARGYCHALSVPELLREISLAVNHGGLWIGPELMGRIMKAVGRLLSDHPEPPVPDTLSVREREVANAVTAGLSNKEIARDLGITERTVKAHLSAIFEKLGVRDRMQLALRLSGQ